MVEQRISEGMMERKKDTPSDSKLRQLAEKKIDMDGRKAELLAEVSPEEMANQLHELQVHQIELKMQNDELRRIHEELEESRDKYSHLYDFAPIGYFTVTEKGIINEANLTLAYMLGVNRTVLLGKPFSRFVLKENQDIFYKYRQKLLETETSQICELQLVKKDSHEFFVRLEAIVIQNEKGPKQIRVILSDITELRRSEEGLLRSEAKYSSLGEAHEFAENVINTVREPLIALDQDLRVVTVSRSFYDFFKVKPEETMGQLIYDLGNKQWDIPKLRELLENILPEKTAFDNYEVEHDFASIGRRTMLLNARQIEQAMGKERIILLAIEDISERKKIEAGLEKTRKELAIIKIAADEVSEYAESIINTVREPLIALDQDLRVVSVSRSFYDFFRVKPEETMGQLIYDLGNKQWDIPKLRELLETILPEKTSFDNYEVEHDFATIGRRTMLLNARQIEQMEGKERIILLAIEDITERKHAEAIIEASLAEKVTLLKEVHHRVKNNMQVISSLLRLQARKFKDRDLAEILIDSQNRITSMALVYNKLYQSENLAQINIADYSKELVMGLIVIGQLFFKKNHENWVTLFPFGFCFNNSSM